MKEKDETSALQSKRDFMLQRVADSFGVPRDDTRITLLDMDVGTLLQLHTFAAFRDGRLQTLDTLRDWTRSEAERMGVQLRPEPPVEE